MVKSACTTRQSDQSWWPNEASIDQSVPWKNMAGSYHNKQIYILLFIITGWRALQLGFHNFTISCYLSEIKILIFVANDHTIGEIQSKTNNCSSDLNLKVNSNIWYIFLQFIQKRLTTSLSYIQHLQYRGLLSKGRICSLGSKFFPFRVYLYKYGNAKAF